MAYDKDKSVNDKGPTHRQLKNEEEANYDHAQNKRDIQPEGGKDKGIEHGNSSGTHAEGQYDKRDDDATMHPSSIDE